MKFKNLITAMSLTLLLISFGGTAQEDLTDKELLQALDDARFINASSFTFTVEILAQRPDGDESSTVKLFFKEIDGEEYSRVEFLAPQDQVGQIYLTTPDGTFFSSPDVDEPLLISGAQSVAGDATVVQTVGILFSDEYTIATRESTTLEDGSPALLLGLEGIDSSVTFPSISVTVDEMNLTVLTMTVFALSGDPVNQVTFEEYGDLDGDLYASRQLIQSELIPENRTLLSTTEFTVDELSDDLFDPEQL